VGSQAHRQAARQPRCGAHGSGRLSLAAGNDRGDRDRAARGTRLLAAAAESVAVGDVLLGAGAKPRDTGEPLRLCPERWLGKATHGDLRESLAPLLEYPVESVLVSHGEPVLSGGAAALAAALAG
jgi:hypothetical protein